MDVDELEKTISRVLSYVITEDGSSQQARDALKALAARLRQAERKAEYAWKFVGRCEVAEGKLREAEARVRELEAALPLLRSELDWCIGYAATAEHEAWGERLLKRLHVARALLGSGEGQEAG